MELKKWACPKCGHTYESEQPKNCPECGSPPSVDGIGLVIGLIIIGLCLYVIFA